MRGYARVLKYNPYHDEFGHFTSKDKAAAHSKLGDSLGRSLHQHAVAVEPRITRAVSRAVLKNGRLIGLDFRLKTEESLQEKVVRDSIEKRLSNKQAAGLIGDAVRYTAEFPTDEYVHGVEATLNDLYSKGYKLHKRPRNAWATDPLTDYQGINAQIRDKNGYVFELQFHTPESFHTKEVVNHKLYEKKRAVGTTQKEAEALTQRMIDNQKKVPVPKNVRMSIESLFDKLMKT